MRKIKILVVIIVLALFLLLTGDSIFHKNVSDTNADFDTVSDTILTPDTEEVNATDTYPDESTGFTIFKYVTIILYFVIIFILCIYGFHRLVLIILYSIHKNDVIVKPPLQTDANLPYVTIQLPLFNERTVAERSILTMEKIDYPRDRFEVQVLDDSTDDTVELCKELVEKLVNNGVDAVHIHRTDRTGYKAGALENGMKVAKGEFIAIFDADFVAPEKFLQDMMPYFQDEKIGMVQSRWEHINREYSQLTKTQAVMLDAHFVIEHFARNRSGRLFNFNGTAGIWRKQAIYDAGGWEHETVTEDMDLSYRAQLKGWKFLYVPEVTAPAELPVEMDAFKSQQYRWSKGSTQVCFKMLPTILKSDQPFKVKAEAYIHLTANFSYLLMLFLSILMVPAIYARLGGSWRDMLMFDMPVFIFGTLSVLDYFITSQRAIGREFGASLKNSLFVIAVGMGLSINNARAVLSACLRRESPFVRTPKYGIDGKGQIEVNKKAPKRYKPQKSIIPYIEVVFGMYFVASIIWALFVFAWPSIPFLLLFAIGYSYNGWCSI
ncbi:MAG: glycosyltransferase family 2 protein, partial [Planctomycetes bacterium]|nr:glycosyltransferase family 2 protein [Planctomycetota bacterium]